MNSKSDYQPPVSQLLTIGRPQNIGPNQWFDYVEAYGFTEDHVPDLIRMASDKNWNWEDEGECYASIHAYRTLGQLKAESAITPLLSLLGQDDSDWYMEDLPRVFSMIGPTCIPTLTDYLVDGKHSSWGKMTAASGLTNIAKSYPVHREECTQLLTDALARHKQQPSELNGSLVAKLLDLEATDAADVIEKAYKEGPMDEMVCGSWARVQIELGLATAADFTPEELQHKVPEWMEPIQKMADLVTESAQAQAALRMSAKAGAKDLRLPQFGKGSLESGKTKPNSGFGSQRPKKKKNKKQR